MSGIYRAVESAIASTIEAEIHRLQRARLESGYDPELPVVPARSTLADFAALALRLPIGNGVVTFVRDAMDRRVTIRVRLDERVAYRTISEVRLEAVSEPAVEVAKVIMDAIAELKAEGAAK